MKNKFYLFIILFLFPLFVCSQLTINMQKKNGLYYIPCKVNGNNLDFIFDTGATDVSISLTEAIKMLKKGLIENDDFLGEVYYQVATGEISKGVKINLRTIEIEKIIIKNVEATIVLDNPDAPLLLGQSVFSKIGKFEFDPTNQTLKILNNNIINESIVIDAFKNVLYNRNGLIDNFCDFKLLQYEDCIINQYGKPILTQNSGSEKFLKYKLSNDENADLYFSVSKLPESYENKQITAIQLSGKSSKFSVRGIELGSSQSLIYENLGKPSKVSSYNIDGKTVKQLDFDKINISFIISDGVVESIKVFYGNITEETEFKNEQLANFKVLKNALKNFTTEELMHLFRPDFEISVADNYIYFENGFKEDLTKNDMLKKFIENKENGLKSLLNPSVLAENYLRLKTYDDKAEFLYVLKIKNSPYINEIVLKKYFGRLLIWEIN